MISSKGFTFIELLTVVAIIAVAAAIAVPSFRDVIANNRLASTSNSILNALQIARSEAVTQHAVIKVCAANDTNTACSDSTNWTAGLLVMRGSVVLRVITSANPGVTVESSRNDVEYQGNGTTSSGNIAVSDARGGTRNIKINVIGQACSGQACS